MPNYGHARIVPGHKSGVTRYRPIVRDVKRFPGVSDCLKKKKVSTLVTSCPFYSTAFLLHKFNKSIDSIVFGGFFFCFLFYLETFFNSVECI